jgi:carboxylesterase
MTELSSASKDLQFDAGPHAVLMLHGLGAAPLELTRLAQEAHQEGFSVRVPNIDGYCYGSDPKPFTYWRDQVFEHYWACKKSYDSVSVLGVSMGATLGLLLAEHEMPASVVALSAGLGYDGWAIPWYHGFLFLGRWVPYASSIYQYVEREPYGLKNQETRSMVKRMMKSQHISEVGAEVLSLDLILEGKRLIKAVKSVPEKIQSPVLFMHSVDDESVHVRNPENLYRRISSKVKEFIYLGDSYHMITIDNERDLVRKESLRFLKSSVNQAVGHAAFDVPNIQSYELRRLLEVR